MMEEKAYEFQPADRRAVLLDGEGTRALQDIVNQAFDGQGLSMIVPHHLTDTVARSIGMVLRGQTPEAHAYELNDTSNHALHTHSYNFDG